MKLTKQAQELKKIRDDGLEPTDKLEDLACQGGSEGFGYALFEGGYIDPQDWIDGEDLTKLEDAIAVVDEFRAIFEELREEM